MTTRFGLLDILSVIEEGRGFEELLSQTVAIEFRGHKFYVLSLDIIVELKRGSKDPEDQYRLPILEETLRQMCEETEGSE